MPLIEEDSQPALWVLVTIYRRLLEKITDRKYDVFGRKISLTVREKVIILGKGLVKRLA
jgi:phytoene synthase